MRKSLLFVGLMTVLAAPAIAQSGAKAPAVPGDVNGNFQGQSRGSGLKGFLSPEQQVMWMREQHISPDKRSSFQNEQTQKLAAMNQGQRLALQTRLQKSWDDLPDKEKDRIHQQLAGRMTQQNSGVR